MASASIDNKWIGWPFQGDVKDFFNKLPETGTKVDIKGSSPTSDIGVQHIQGIAIWSNWILLTHSRDSKGCILACNSEIVHEVDTEGKHPGGCQVVGSYLVIPDKHSDDNTTILFADLTPLLSNSAPTIINFKHKLNYPCGCIGAANWTNASGTRVALLAALNEKTHSVELFEVNPTSQELTSLGTISMGDDAKDVNGMGLVVENSSNDVYLITTVTKHLGGTNDDHALLYKLSVANLTKELIKDRHLKATHGTTLGMDGVHFRWGGAVTAYGTVMQGLASARNFVGGKTAVNFFNYHS